MLLIKNGYMIDPRSKREGYFDLCIDGDKIVKIGEQLCAEEEAEIIDARGCIVTPGFIDVHVHFRDPGFTYKEDIESGALTAAKGGFTTVILMANTNPAVDTIETLEYILEKGKQTAIHIETCACVTQGMKGKALVDMKSMVNGGSVGFTDDGVPIMKEALLEEAMKEVCTLGVPISLHEEDPAYIKQNGINSTIAKEAFQLEGSPREAEIVMVERDLQIAIKTGALVNIQHISTKEAVELVRLAKKQCDHIYAEAAPHHFSLTEEALKVHQTLAKMNPPLRAQEDRMAIIEGLKDGTIDCIATDHAPHSQEEKAREFALAPSGIIGLETALSLGIMNLVQEGHLSMCELLGKMSANPAKLYGLDRGYLATNAMADIVIFNSDKSEIYEESLSKSSNSPFLGENMTGVVEYTICKGKIAYKREGKGQENQ